MFKFSIGMRGRRPVRQCDRETWLRAGQRDRRRDDTGGLDGPASCYLRQHHDAPSQSHQRLNPDAAHASASAAERASSAGTQRGPAGVCTATDRRYASRAMPIYVPRRPRNGWLAQMTLRLGALERLRRRDFLLDAELCFMCTSALGANESIGRRQSRSGFKRIRCKQRGNRAREEVRTGLTISDDGKCRQEQSAGYPSQPPTGQ